LDHQRYAERRAVASDLAKQRALTAAQQHALAVQLERYYQLYALEKFDAAWLERLTAEPEATRTTLSERRVALAQQLVSQGPTDDEIASFRQFTEDVRRGAVVADFARKRQIIDWLDVQVELAVEDGEQVAYVTCLLRLEPAPLAIVSTTSSA
jgi:hypothetical protein